jgi:hypothetical protein
MKSALLALALTVGVTAIVSADPKNGRRHSKKPHGNGMGASGETHVVAGVRFSTADERAIHEYYRPRYKSLPPGLQKKVARGGQLPPGWQKRMQPMPIDLERRLGPLPREYGRGVIDGHAVIYDTRTRVVIDATVLF